MVSKRKLNTYKAEGNPALTQTIKVVIGLKLGQEPYKMLSRTGYNALFHFFEDIDYHVDSIDVGEPE